MEYKQLLKARRKSRILGQQEDVENLEEAVEIRDDFFGDSPGSDIVTVDWFGTSQAMAQLGKAVAVEYVVEKLGDKVKRYRHEFEGVNEDLFYDPESGALLIKGPDLEVTERGIEGSRRNKMSTLKDLKTIAAYIVGQLNTQTLPTGGEKITMNPLVPGPFPPYGPAKSQSNPSLSEEDTLKVLDAWDEIEKDLVKDLDVDEDAIREALVDYFLGTDTEDNQSGIDDLFPMK